MRKFILALMVFLLALFPCAALAGTTTPFSDFTFQGLTHEYAPDMYVLLREDGGSYYGFLTGYQEYSTRHLHFVGRLSGTVTSKDLPYGTLTIIDESADNPGKRLTMEPDFSNWTSSTFSVDYVVGDIPIYDSRYVGDRSNLGSKFMYNILTSPDVIIGTVELPTETTVSTGRSFDVNEILPYVKVNFNSSNSELADSIELSFVRSGDWSTPVAAGITNVHVHISGRSTNDNGGGYMGGEDDSSFYPTFSGTQTITVSENKKRLDNIGVSYIMNGSSYHWNFSTHMPGGGNLMVFSDWGALDVKNGPLEIPAGTTKEIIIKIPANATMTLRCDENGNIIEEITDGTENYTERQATAADIFHIGNSEVLSIDQSSMKFTQGTGLVDPITYGYSTISINFNALKPGKTALRTFIPFFVQIDGQTYGGDVRLFEIHVTDTNGNIPTTGDNDSVTPKVKAHTSQVLLIDGKPHYETAEFTSLGFTKARFGIGYFSDQEVNIPSLFFERPPVDNTGDDWNDYPYTQIYVGLIHGDITEIFWSEAGFADKEVALNEWVSGRYSPEYNYERFDGSSGRAVEGVGEDLSKYTIWWEFPDDPSLNLVSASLKAKVVNANDMVTTAEQLNNFVPYVEVKCDDNGEPKQVEWSFIDSKTLAKKTPEGITNISVGRAKIDDGVLSGTVDVEECGGGYDTILFRYDYDGITYSWCFVNQSPMYSHGNFGTPIAVGENKTFREWVETGLESVSIITRNDGTTTVTPLSFNSTALSANNGEISFDVSGVKAGSTILYLLIVRDIVIDDLGDLWNKYEVRPMPIYVYDPANLNTTIAQSELNVKVDDYIVHADVIEGEPYYKGAVGNANISLTRNVKVTNEDFNNKENNVALRGTLHTFNGSQEIETEYLDPWYNYENETVVYNNLGLDSDATRISWEFPNNVNTSGNFDLVANVRLLSRQLTTYKPYIKFNRSGLNVSTIEWYFVDEDNNRVTTPSSISAISVDIYASGSNFNDYSRSGLINVNKPEVAISSITIAFVDGGINYHWYLNCFNSGENDKMLSSDIKPQPIIMYVGDERTLTLTAEEADTVEPVLGNINMVSTEDNAVVSMKVIASAGNTTKVNLKALSAGMTSITLIASQTNKNGKEEFYPTSPHEIWVAEYNSSTGKYEIPGLASDAEELIKTLTSESIPTSDTDNTDDADDATEDPKGNNTGTENDTENNSGNSTGNSTRKIEAKAISISVPKFDYKSDNAITQLVKKLLNVTSTDVNLYSIESADVLESGDVSVTIPGKQAGAHLDKIKITYPGIYFFRVALANFYSGMYLYWYPMPQVSNGASVSVVAATNAGEGKAAFLDNDGKELEDSNKLSQDGQEIVVAAYLEAQTYSPIIATDAEGNLTGSSGSGCDLGFSLAGLAVMFLLVIQNAKKSK